ncbi:hypothetical protein ES703_02329 [subsurface metagenome]
MKIPAELLDLHLAYRRLKEDLKTDFIHYPIEKEVFDYRREENLEQLRFEMEDDYKPVLVRRIDVPKQNRTLRPGAVPRLKDRIVLQALIDSIAETVGDQLIPDSDNVVFSHRVKKNGDEHLFKLGGYERFEERTLSGLQSGERYLLETDIAAYFEHVDMGRLAAILSGFGVESGTTNNILEVITAWNGTKYHGLPQGTWPSDFLGNIYLDPLDKYMLRRGHDYFRYGDDIRVFGNSKLELHRALKDLTVELRSLHLNLQTEKTLLLHGTQLKKYVDYRHSRLQEFSKTLPPVIIVNYEYGGDVQVEEQDVTVEDIQKSEELLLQYLRKHVFRSDDKYDARMLRYCIGLLTRLGSSVAEDEVLHWLPHCPAETKLLVNYLGTSNYFKKIKDALIGYLASEENIYEWSEMWALEYLIRAKERFEGEAILDAGDMKVVRGIANDKNRHWICRFKAIRICGLYGDDQDRRALMESYDDEPQLEIQYAIVLACEKLNPVQRNRFYQLCEGQNNEMNQLICCIMNK